MKDRHQRRAPQMVTNDGHQRQAPQTGTKPGQRITPSLDNESHLGLAAGLWRLWPQGHTACAHAAAETGHARGETENVRGETIAPWYGDRMP